MPYNPNASYGRALLDLVAGTVPVFGNINVVVSASDYADPNYTKLYEIFKVDNGSNAEVRLFTTVAEAYANCTSNNNDVIVLDAHSTHDVGAGLTVAKNRVHFIGFDGGKRRVQQGTKLQLASGEAAVLINSGVRNSYHNIKFINASSTGVGVVADLGEGTLFEDCSFVFSDATPLTSTSVSEFFCSSDSATHLRCSYGTDVLKTTVARAVFTLCNGSDIGQAANDGAKSNRFIDCEYVVMSSSANANLVKLSSTSGAKFLNRFVNPSFIAVINNTNSAIAVTNAVASAAGFVEGSIVLEKATTANCTNGCAGVTDKVVITGSPVFTSNAWEGGTPA